MAPDYNGQSAKEKGGNDMGMQHALRLGLAYFAAIFGLGFLLGTIRTLLVEPRIGALPAVALELPVMLGAAWVICGRLVRGHDLTTGARAVMGATAFALLMLAELALALAFGQTLTQYLQNYATPAPQLGLAGQILFGLLPLLRRSRA